MVTGGAIGVESAGRSWFSGGFLHAGWLAPGWRRRISVRERERSACVVDWREINAARLDLYGRQMQRKGMWIPEQWKDCGY
jgi:hypothetical protein